MAEKALVAVSGGIDSAFACLLLQEAGYLLECVFLHLCDHSRMLHTGGGRPRSSLGRSMGDSLPQPGGTSVIPPIGDRSRPSMPTAKGILPIPALSAINGSSSVSCWIMLGRRGFATWLQVIMPGSLRIPVGSTTFWQPWITVRIRVTCFIVCPRKLWATCCFPGRLAKAGSDPPDAIGFFLVAGSPGEPGSLLFATRDDNGSFPGGSRLVQ